MQVKCEMKKREKKKENRFVCSNNFWPRIKYSVLILSVSVAQHKCQKFRFGFHAYSKYLHAYLPCCCYFHHHHNLRCQRINRCLFVYPIILFSFSHSLSLPLPMLVYSLCVCVFESAMTLTAGHMNRTLLIFAHNTTVVLVVKCFKRILYRRNKIEQYSMLYTHRSLDTFLF